ncbi:MAG: arylsulfatase [Bryobacteraceae bacterium]
MPGQLTRRQALGAPFLLRSARAAGRPNIILILADDLGFSDLGCYGGEIRTPNLDSLAARGVRFTQMYNSARCCPSRASIMTGLYPHQAGVGLMTGDDKLPGYRGRIVQGATIPEVLKPAGYTTLMGGKWHLGQPGPVGRGFEEYFGMVHGFDSFWNPAVYKRLPEGRPARTYPAGKFYATDAITDHVLDFLAGARRQKKPYFLYLAYNAPHFPLHAPKEDIDRYAGVYAQGWDRIREARYRRMREMKLLDRRWPLTPRSLIPPNRYNKETGWAGKPNPAWDSLDAERRADLARRMAVYAAMVDRMDRNIGRVLEDLRRADELDNTLIFFLSDNGACAEWDPYGFDGRSGPENKLHRGAELENMGQPGTYHSYGSAWANTSNTPLRLYKHYAHEGGISTPFIVHWPAGMKRRGEIDHRPGHITDLMATCVDAAGASYPKGVPPMEGRSILPALRGERPAPRTIFFEHEGNRGVREGKWKLACLAGGEWELYDEEADRTEMRDLARAHPEVVRELARKWDEWALRANVYRNPGEKK